MSEEQSEPYKMSPAEEALRDYLMDYAQELYAQRGDILKVGGEPTHISIPKGRYIPMLAGSTFLGLPLQVEAVNEPVVRSKRGAY